jgi:deoxyribodipyrimidine photolyase
VLYCLRTALRANGNPALETALHCSQSLNVPLLCVAVLEDTFPDCMARNGGLLRRPTDRSVAFRLEALRELQPALASRGTTLYVHVEREGCRAAVAMSLAAKACLVIFDDHFGIQPHMDAADRIHRTGAPIWLCDTACTLPSVTLIHTGALSGGNAGFLRATAAAREARLRAADIVPAPAPRQPPPTPPPAWSVDLSPEGAIDELLAAPSRRDVSVGRSRHTRGGPRAALRRWMSYVDGGGLKQYAAHRNNPLATDGKGASRMSAYINSGMIDPMRIARDAQREKSDKFLSEFVGFRESAHLWCMLHPGGYANASTAVPAWAQGQLRSAADPTPGVFSPSVLDLENGQSGDALWDDCQRCLVISGELHNNVRMAWGKAIPNWHHAALVAAAAATPASPATPAVRLQAALDLLIHLNDKFALDGGSPPSYGGILWCLGWRDRPGSGGCPTARPTSVMTRRIKPGDLERKARQRCGALSFSACVGSFSASASSSTATPAAPAFAEAEGEEEDSGAAVGGSGRIALASAEQGAMLAPPAKRKAGSELPERETSRETQIQKGKATSLPTPVSGRRQDSLWTFINRQSANALPPRGARPT